MAQDFLVRQLKNSILRLTQTPVRVTEPYQHAEQQVRDSVRQISRSRVSHLLRQLRAAHGFSYAQVQATTGLTQQLLFDVEFKDRRLSLDELRLLADCYQVAVGDILGIDLD